VALVGHAAEGGRRGARPAGRRGGCITDRLDGGEDCDFGGVGCFEDWEG
jgi:hypothetical protein